MLTSWKAVARFFDRDVRTVQRWEKEEGLPVHRHSHRRQSSVYAFPNELEAWWRERGSRAAVGDQADPPVSREGGPAPASAGSPLQQVSEHPAIDVPRRARRRASWLLAAVVVVGLALATFVRVRLLTSNSTPARLVASYEGPIAEGFLQSGPIADLNGDGTGDLVTVAPHAREIHLIFGRRDLNVSLPSAADVIVRGMDNGPHVVAAASDYDGDGLNDLLVSVTLFEPDAFHRTGPTYLLRGRREWPAALQLPDAADVTFRVSLPKDIRLAACGPHRTLDLNHDGISDLLLGGADYSPAGRASAGGAFIFFGRRAWSREIDVERDADVIIAGSRTGEGLTSACDAGDFNGDGRTDVAILAREHTLWNLLGSRGRYYLFFGRDQWPRRMEAGSDADLLIVGRRPGAGISAPLLADVNGDGFQDLLGSFSGQREAPPWSELVVAFGRPTTPDAPRLPSASADDSAIRYAGASNLGAAMTAADLDADGRDDVMLTAPGSGTVYVLMGRKDWPAIARIVDLQPRPIFVAAPGAGESPTWAGDLDGDDLPEISFAAPSYASYGVPHRGKAWFITPYLPIAIDLRPMFEPNILYHPGILVARISGRAMPANDRVDAASVRLAGVAPSRHLWQDFDGDHVEDLQLYFDTSAMSVTATTKRLHLTASTVAGVLVHGSDSVVVLPGGTDTMPNGDLGATHLSTKR
ncbi:MAG TPA: VCBS repeat-containing protein [Vicinamibacterales bacterium]|nr:VCBS repeat-containing protein [Vicinamibacterales bacterium]